MVTDIKAVNRFTAAGLNSSDADCEYIECASGFLSPKHRSNCLSWNNRDSTVPNQPAGVFWAVVNRLLIIFQVIFLILSEVEWPMSFFDRFFPVLGSQFGLGALGIFECLYAALDRVSLLCF